MWSTLESLFVSFAITALKLAIKSPSGIKAEGAVIAQLAQLSTEADMLANGNIWTETPAAAPSVKAA